MLPIRPGVPCQMFPEDVFNDVRLGNPNRIAVSGRRLANESLFQVRAEGGIGIASLGTSVVTGGLWPSESVEVQEDLLRVLDLRRFDRDRARCRNLDWRAHQKFWNGLPSITGLNLDRNR